MDVESIVQESPQNNVDSLDNSENFMEGFEPSPAENQESRTTISVLTEEQYNGLIDAITLVYQNNHVDAIMLQGEIAQDTFGASFLLCGVLCALILFKGLFK